MKLWWKVVIALCLLVQVSSFALDDSPFSEQQLSLATGQATTICTSMLSNMDVVLAKSYVFDSTIVKGALGEAVAGRNYLSAYLAKTGNWVSISPRVGPNGIDHVFVKADPKTGMPKGLIVGESKYNTSQLGQTRDGIQLGRKWINKRLKGLGNRYLQMSDVRQCAPLLASTPKYNLAVKLRNGKTVLFWKTRSTDSWKVDCNPSELAEAQRIAKIYGSYLKAAGDGKIAYRSRLFQIKPKGDNLTIIIKDASNLDKVRKVSLLKNTGIIKLEGVLKEKIPEDMMPAIESSFRKKLPGLSEGDIRKVAKKIVDEESARSLKEAQGKIYVVKNIVINSLFALTASVVLDIGQQLLLTRKIKWKKTAVVGVVAGASTAAAQGINIVLMESQWMARLAGKLNCSSVLLSSVISSVGGGILFSGLSSLGMYCWGYVDKKEAIRGAMIGAGSSIAGGAAVLTTMALVSAFGTASTGTAIATLSGAAATNATLAALGGGAISAGGGGMAVGAMVLSGIGVAAAIVAVPAIVFSYKAYDAKQETNRITAVCDKIDNQKFWKSSWENQRAALLIPASVYGR